MKCLHSSVGKAVRIRVRIMYHLRDSSGTRGLEGSALNHPQGSTWSHAGGTQGRGAPRGSQSSPCGEQSTFLPGAWKAALRDSGKSWLEEPDQGEGLVSISGELEERCSGGSCRAARPRAQQTEQLRHTAVCYYPGYIYYHRSKYLSAKRKLIEELSLLLYSEYLIITSLCKTVHCRKIKEKVPSTHSIGDTHQSE